jgi:hypothetical protein
VAIFKVAIQIILFGSFFSQRVAIHLFTDDIQQPQKNRGIAPSTAAATHPTASYHHRKPDNTSPKNKLSILLYL